MRCVYPACDVADCDVSINITLYRFPEEESLRTAWLEALGKIGWDMEEDSAVCSKHFLTEDFLLTRSGRALRLNAVPINIQVCRICFARNCKLYPIKDDKQLALSRPSYALAYETLTGLSIDREDKLPPYLCIQCANQLLKCVRFRAKSIRAHSILMDILNDYGHITLETIQAVSRFYKTLSSEIINNENDSECIGSDSICTDEQDLNQEDFTYTIKSESVDIVDHDIIIPNVKSTAGQGCSSNLQNNSIISVVKTEKDNNINDDIEIIDDICFCRPQQVIVDDDDDDGASIDVLFQDNTNNKLNNNQKDKESNKYNSKRDSSKGNVNTESNKDNSKRDSSKGNVNTESNKDNSKRDSSKGNVNTESNKDNSKRDSSKGSVNTESNKDNPKRNSIRGNVNTKSDDNSKRESSKGNVNTESNKYNSIRDSGKGNVNPVSKKDNANREKSNKGNIDIKSNKDNIHRESNKSNKELNNGDIDIETKSTLETYKDKVTKQLNLSFSGMGNMFKGKDCSLDGALSRKTTQKENLCPTTVKEANTILEGLNLTNDNKTRKSKDNGGLLLSFKLLSCDICKYQTVSNIKLMHHLESHSASKVYNCSNCYFLTNSKKSLRFHNEIHCNKNKYICDICKKKFTFKNDLITHVRIHSGEKPFSCNICNKKFRQQNQVTAHLRIHTGERPYSCNVCKKSFRQRGHLKNHLQIHSGEKPYSCDLCKKSFIQRGQLQNHLHTHTNAKPYSCDTCGKCFSIKSTLHNHKRVHTK